MDTSALDGPSNIKKPLLADGRVRISVYRAFERVFAVGAVHELKTVRVNHVSTDGSSTHTYLLPLGGVGLAGYRLECASVQQRLWGVGNAVAYVSPVLGDFHFSWCLRVVGINSDLARRVFAHKGISTAHAHKPP